MKTITRTIYKGRQSWNLDEYRRYGDVKRRVTIRRDTYDNQAVAKIEQWSDTTGWNVVVSLPVVDTPLAPTSCAWKREQIEQPITDTANLLFQRAEELLD